MSIDNTLPDNPITTDHDGAHPDGDNRPATDRSATAADHLWAALHARPGGTAEQLSTDAGIGRSTAAKILARWVADGTASRVPTDGKRSASRFAIATPDDSTAEDGTDGAATVPSDPHAAPQAHPLDVNRATDGPTDAAGDPVGEVDNIRDENHPDTTASDCPDRDCADAGTTTRSSGAPPEVGAVEANNASTTDRTPDPVSNAPGPTRDPGAAASTPADDSTDSTDGARSVPTGPGRRRRLAAGALHGMVEDYLRDHPDGEFGPTKVGHDLARSTGAVGNALDRLVASGYAIRTKDRPKRYTLAPTGSTGDAAGPSGDRDA